jgi:uncharacterized membrane protein YfcA
MTNSYEITLLILCPLVFLAGFVDSIAGGGGLISIPAYIFAGVPIHNAYGTNKAAMCLGTGVSVVNYFRGKKVHYRAALAGVLGALPGSALGTMLAASLSPRALQICLMIILPGSAIFLIFHHSGFGLEKPEPPPAKTFILSLCIGFAIGAYDGFFGPGTGMFITLALAGLVHLELVKAAGTTRVINFASNLASMVTWFFAGKILFALAIPCMICTMAGNFLGSRLAIKIGAKFIRPVILVVAALLFIRVLTDLTGILN